MACNEMFGNFDGAKSGDMSMGDVDMNAYFNLVKCEIGLFDPMMNEYYQNMNTLYEAARLIDQKQSALAH
jgi:hypothetical protein